jgi:large subunit ribosomal protein L32
MAVPKKRTSKARKRMRRAHDSLTAPNLSPCPQCGESRLPHRVCSSCGHYRGRRVFEVEAEDEL